MFNEKVLENLPEDTNEAILTLCRNFFTWCGVSEEGLDDFDFECGCVKALGILNAFLNSRGLGELGVASIPEDGGTREILDVFKYAETEAKDTIRGTLFDVTTERYAAFFGRGFFYEFEAADLDRMQVLINELRDVIGMTEEIEEGHRARLLNRLEKLQGELHKRVSDVDRIWGFVGDAGVVLRKLGEDAKPIVERVVEMANIAFKVQSKAEGLTVKVGESVFKMLTAKSKAGVKGAGDTGVTKIEEKVGD